MSGLTFTELAAIYRGVWCTDVVCAVQDGASGAIRQLRGIMLNVTREKEAGRQLRRHEKELRLAHKMRAIGVLAAGLAHELNNPLGVILVLGSRRVWSGASPRWSSFDSPWRRSCGKRSAASCWCRIFSSPGGPNA